MASFDGPVHDGDNGLTWRLHTSGPPGLHRVRLHRGTGNGNGHGLFAQWKLDEGRWDHSWCQIDREDTFTRGLVQRSGISWFIGKQGIVYTLRNHLSLWYLEGCITRLA